ncbi:ABC transporter substrate-binding protein [Streptosporangium roseum]|uniref:ABC-type dipeptide transport system periplasmic component-like protein n=1 Tax=Streptosporangium roseum (strain ATCC 12428 / DSM 43021 / JCM 3005 / KCTC 9067 / NCIMB 10171 / NRRL 2505 / NI 9100) TaxID=479432 RepID=D2ARA8_STRRD|nr:ABC transporter substrate-binding protein [Streptosporangium roseum]ACZ88449.1 ABC-type dipeptide transport system periplasmic component-like protein [Streptosporangium roseum DSM 43021]
MKRLAAVAALLGLAAVTACSGSTGDKPAASGGSGGSGGGLYTTIDGLKPGLDVNGPINPWNPKGNAFVGLNAMRIAWSKNHMTDPNQFYPGIAESWEIAPDNSSITLHLHPDNKWSDGKPVTAEDVKFSIALAYTQGSTAFAIDPGAAGAASEVEVVDDKTVKITQDMDNPSVTFVRGVMDSYIVPQHVWSSVLTADFWDKLKAARGEGAEAEKAREEITALSEKVLAFAPPKDVSAGPFTLERMNPSEALLVKNKNFYNAANVGPDQVKLLNYTGNEQIWNYLIAGKLDNAPFTAVPADVMKRISSTPGNGVIKGYSPVSLGMAFNQAKKPYDNVHVRRGLAYLINRDEITKIASPEGGTPALTTTGIHQKPAAEWLGADLATLEPYKLDAAKAEEEFKKAGLKKDGGKWTLPDGTPWKFTVNVPAPFSDWISGAKAITSQLTEAGIDAEVVTTADYPLYLKEIAEGKYDVGFWLIALGPAPYNIYQRLYGASNGWSILGGKIKHAEPGKNGNWMGGPETIEVDGAKVNPGELTAKLNSASGDEQKKIIGQLAKAANQDLPVVQLWDYVNTQFVNTNRFSGFPENDSDLLRQPSGVWIQLGMVKKQ